MKNQFFILIFLGIVTCKDIQPDEILESKTAITENTDNLLKTELERLLTESYQKRSFDSLTLFLEKWKSASDKIEPTIGDSLTTNLYQIFYEIYHPFELEKYDWMKREHYKKYKYALTPPHLIYRHDNSVIDTLSNFRPKNELKNASVLNSIPVFDNILTEFLKKEENSGEDFLANILLMPINFNKIEFRTSPEVIEININKEMNKAKANIRLISTGLEITLIKLSNKWDVTEIKQLWIE